MLAQLMKCDEETPPCTVFGGASLEQNKEGSMLICSYMVLGLMVKKVKETPLTKIKRAGRAMYKKSQGLLYQLAWFSVTGYARY
ncbi:unnamed protein product [Angiostrongylus costaricensis]|uniref:Ovule protein n=1 Tax=Angiostrongylus costaricensis TaxID=334426 RepID=A0A0R3PBN6_ANGCS|nr:unnamed protein product [Angiostrongylus costaricensis]